MLQKDAGTYVGQVKNGHRHGYGTMKWTTGHNEGTRYFGNWDEDMPSGQGTKIWDGANEYTGNFEKGQKHGYGIETLSDGTIFKGHYEVDQRQGIKMFVQKHGEQEETQEVFYEHGLLIH